MCCADLRKTCQLLLYIWMVVAAKASFLEIPALNETKEFLMPLMLFSPVQNISGFVMYVEGAKSCGNYDARGMLVLVTVGDSCMYSKKIRVAQEGGAIGVILLEGFIAGALSRVALDTSFPVTIPIYQLNLDSHDPFSDTVMDCFQMNITVFANITIDDNIWLDIYDGAPFVAGQVILCIFYAIAIFYLWLNTYFFIKDKGIIICITLVTFGLEFIGLLLMFVTSLDLAYSRGYYVYGTADILTQIYVHISALTNILMAFAFLEVFGRKMVSSPSPFLSKYKYIFLSIGGSVFGIRMISLILRMAYVINTGTDVTIGGIILFMEMGFSIGLLISVVVKTTQALSQYVGSKRHSAFERLVKIVNQFVICCIIGSVSFLLIISFLVFGPFAETTTWGRILLNAVPIVLGFLSLLKLGKLGKKTPSIKSGKLTTNSRVASKVNKIEHSYDTGPQSHATGTPSEEQTDKT